MAKHVDNHLKKPFFEVLDCRAAKPHEFGFVSLLSLPKVSRFSISWSSEASDPSNESDSIRTGRFGCLLDFLLSAALSDRTPRIRSIG